MRWMSSQKFELWLNPWTRMMGGWALTIRVVPSWVIILGLISMTAVVMAAMMRRIGVRYFFMWCILIVVCDASNCF